MEKCFADDGHGGCMALREKECKGCKFYKTEEKYMEGVRKTRQAIKEAGGELYYGKLP